MAKGGDVDALQRRLHGMATAMEQAQRTTAANAGELIRSETDKRIKAAAGGDGVLSGMTRTTGGRSKAKPRPMGARVRVRKGSMGWEALVRATGPVHLVERDVAPHVVTSRHAKGAEFTRQSKAGRTVKGRSTRESRQASVLFGLGLEGGGRRAVLHWGGSNYARWTVASSKGRQPWAKGVDAARPRLGEIQAQAQRAAIRSALR